MKNTKSVKSFSRLSIIGKEIICMRRAGETFKNISFYAHKKLSEEGVTSKPVSSALIQSYIKANASELIRPNIRTLVKKRRKRKV